MMRKRLLHALLGLLLLLTLAAPGMGALAADEEVRVEVTADPTELSEGGPVQFTFEVSNYSDFELHEIAISLDNATFTIPGMEDCVIPPGGSAVFPLLYEVPDSRIGLELLFHVSWLRYGEPFSVDVPVTIARAVEPVITIARTVDSEFAKPGDTVTLTYELANETHFDMTNITVIDEQISDNPILRNHTLNAGATLTQSFVYTMGEEDVTSAPIVTYDVNGKTKSFSAIEPVTLSMVLVDIALEVEMGTPAATGVPFTLTAVNRGNQAVTDISITDELGNPVHEGTFSLDPGESRTYSYLVVPVATEPVRNVAFVLHGTDALGEAYDPVYEQTYEVHPFVDDSQLDVALLPEILEPWTAQTGAVRVRVTIRNTSAVELTQAVLSESTLGELASYDVLVSGDTIFEQELVIGSPRNLNFSIRAVDPAGTERQLTGAMLTVAYPVATDTPAPTALPTASPLGAGTAGWNSTLVLVLIIVGVVMLAAFAALIILAVLEHRRTGGIRLDDYDDDGDDGPDESIDLAFDDDPEPLAPEPSARRAGVRTPQEFVRIAEERRRRFVPTKRPPMHGAAAEFDDGFPDEREQAERTAPPAAPVEERWRPAAPQAQPAPSHAVYRQTPPPIPGQPPQRRTGAAPAATADRTDAPAAPPVILAPPPTPAATADRADTPAAPPVILAPTPAPAATADRTAALDAPPVILASPPAPAATADRTAAPDAPPVISTPQEAAARAPKRLSLRPEPAVRARQRETVRRIPHMDEEEKHE